MKKKTAVHFIIIICIALAGASCKKKKQCSAGAGGNVTVVVFPQHHGKAIPNKANYPDTVFVKFNTQEFPGTNPALFDAQYIGEAGEDHIHLTGLKCGDYFIYAVGFDTTISQRVTGGIPYSFTQTSGEVDLNVPVTE